MKDHGSDGHAHAVGADADRRYLLAALVLIGCFLVAEVVLGIKAQSLALLSDAGHMLTDVGALVLALVAMRLAGRPAGGRYTFGLKRSEILSAQANGLTLVLLGAWLGYEGVRRLIDPPQVEGGLVLVVALAGVAVNLVATWLLSRANRTSLNVEGAFQHLLTDLYAFLGTAVAGLVIVLTGFDRADAIAGLVVAVLMLRSGGLLLRDSGRVLLEAAPREMDLVGLGAAMSAADGVAEVHDLHVWEVTSGFPSMSAHVLVAGELDCHQVRLGLQQLLATRYGIVHSTLQVDHVGDDGAGGAVGAGGTEGCCVEAHEPPATPAGPTGSGGS
ncbi:MAG TPA: cation diffusion facilitator family transporter [Candidatus Nanopelagicales bacterium]|nr:cation diffusion facilitator family transporter [Candidatus Nanopelagicales bacterium]